MTDDLMIVHFLCAWLHHAQLKSTTPTHPPTCNLAASLMIFHHLSELIDINLLLHVYIKQILILIIFSMEPSLDLTGLNFALVFSSDNAFFL